MHKFIPACHLENVDALNTAAQKKNANQNELLKFRGAKTGGKKAINGPLSVMMLAVLTRAPSVQYGGLVIATAGKISLFSNGLCVP